MTKEPRRHHSYLQGEKARTQPTALAVKASISGSTCSPPRPTDEEQMCTRERWPLPYSSSNWTCALFPPTQLQTFLSSRVLSGAHACLAPRIHGDGIVPAGGREGETWPGRTEGRTCQWHREHRVSRRNESRSIDQVAGACSGTGAHGMSGYFLYIILKCGNTNRITI